MDRVSRSFYRILLRTAKVHDANAALKGILVLPVSGLEAGYRVHAIGPEVLLPRCNAFGMLLFECLCVRARLLLIRVVGKLTRCSAATN